VVLLYLLHANEKIFQTGWFTESVISATLIVLIVRTRLPFFKSLPGKYLSIATSLIVVLSLSFLYLPFSGLLGFSKLPLMFFFWMLLIVAAYIITAELAKRWFFSKIKMFPENWAACLGSYIHRSYHLAFNCPFCSSPHGTNMVLLLHQIFIIDSDGMQLSPYLK
jgi:magnesium-transporting ATPase (P-type)